MPPVYTHAFPGSWGTFYLAATERGLCNITFPGHEDGFRDWIARRFGGEQAVPDPGRFGPVMEQLEAYFAGTRRAFDLELDMIGTEFQRRVWRGLQEIPYGTTWSYLDLANHVGVGRGGCRAVGAANGQNPLPVVVPCHRVIGRDGSLTGFGGGLDLKERLLRLEGAWEAGRQRALGLGAGGG